MVTLSVGTLATIGVPRLLKAAEMARTTEAYLMLGNIRTAQLLYHAEHNAYTADFSQLVAGVPPDDSPAHYFRYRVASATPSSFAALAVRKTGNEVGKKPNGEKAYTVTLSSQGVLSGGP